MEDAQVPGSDMVKEYFPDDSDGYLYKMQPWFEFAPFPSSYAIGTAAESYCYFLPYLTTGGVKKIARYRYNFEIRRTPDNNSSYTNLFSLIDAASVSASPNYVANMERLADMDEWMRVFAANHAAGNIDSVGTQISQNMYGYVGVLGTRYTLMPWDLNIDLGGAESLGPGQNLLAYDTGDTNLGAIYRTPAFLRMYWRAQQELVNGALNISLVTGPLMNQKYNAFVANGLSVENPNTAILPWISAAQASISSQLAAVNATAFAVNATAAVSNNQVYVTGVAPVDVATVEINGFSYPVTWTTLTNWVVAVPLKPGVNSLNVAGVDKNGQPIAGDTNNINVTYGSTNVSPIGQIAINEIMYAPPIPNAGFIELYNNSTNTAFDLSGWQLSGVGYTFPAGAFIAPTNYMVLAQNSAAFAGAYGGTNPVFDTFSGVLEPGQLLSLTQPNANGTNSLVVTAVKYDSVLPWPTNANGLGASLQLVDARQDNWRVGNWLAAPYSATPTAINSVATALPSFPSLWINEVQADNLTGITNQAGQRVGWLELYNPSTNAISLNGLYLANNYTNVLQWAFPTNAVINAGQFKVVFADGRVDLSSANELHASFVLASGTGSLALSRLMTNNQRQVLDYVDYQNISPNDSYGSIPDGQSFYRQEFFQATPGTANNGVATPPPSFIAYTQPGQIYTQNFDSLPNPGTSSANADNPITINGTIYSLANPFDFAFPVAASGKTGGLGDSAMAGWYGSGVSAAQLGATDGDQTTGGDISFGLPNSANRALGLLATSSTKGTAFGVRFINGSPVTLTRMNLQFTGEVWRQSNVPKVLYFYYVVDLSGTQAFPATATAFLPALNVSLPTVAGDVNGVAVDGTASGNQINLSVLHQSITNWPPGAALWLVWQMPDSTGKAQGLGIDNLSFSADTVLPTLNVRVSGTNLLMNWPMVTGQKYQLEYKDDLAAPAWTPLGNPVTGTTGALTVTNDFGVAPQRFFRLQLVN
jgi:hypothetical protein